LYQDLHDPNPKLRLVYGDLNNASSLNKLIRTIAPDEIYNLGAQSHVRVSFDYVIATGETHSVRELLDEAFGYLGLDWKKYVSIDPRYYRATEVDLLLGDAAKAQKKLGNPRSNSNNSCG
jgi:GDP-D-mannose dehydratase